MKNKTKIIITSELMYLVVSMSTVVVGTSLTALTEMYKQPLSKIVLFSSAFALGRITTCNFSGKMINKVGPKSVMIVGTILLEFYVLGVVTTDNYYLGLFLSFLGGVGQGTQDTVSPAYLTQVAGKDFSRLMSIGQVLFAAGCFITPFFVTLLLSKDLPFYYANYILLIFPIILLIIAITIKKEKNASKVEEESIVPIYTTNKKMAMIIAGIICTMFTAANTGICTYTTTFATSVGMSDTNASLLLSLFNIGMMIGGLVFSIVNSKFSIIDVFMICIAAGFVIIGSSVLINNQTVYIILFTILGIVLGDIFAKIIILASRIWYDDIAFASSVIAITSGMSDIIFPGIVGKIVEINAVYSMVYVMFDLLVCFLLALLLKKYIKKEQKA